MDSTIRLLHCGKVPGNSRTLNKVGIVDTRMQECNSVCYGYRRLEDVTCGAYLGAKCLLWGILGHEWDIIAHMKFTEFHAKLFLMH